MQRQHFDYHTTFSLNSGDSLPGFSLAYCTWGQMNAEGSNVIWVCHALTGSADVNQWWPGMIGPGKPLDTDRYFIICANVLGGCYGSTGPLDQNPATGKAYYHQFPELNVQDVTRAFDLLRQSLSINAIDLLIGGSLGGQQAVQWAADQPSLIKKLALLATNARHSPWGIAFNETQRMAIEADSSWKTEKAEAGAQGLKAARAIALLSYRTYAIYDEKQQNSQDSQSAMFAAASYQQYQGKKFIGRFNAFTYWILSKMMDSHDVGKNYASTAKALQGIEAKTLVIGIDSDILFPIAEQEFLAQHIPNAHLITLSSPYGHDGFLVEIQAVSEAINELMAFSVEEKKVNSKAAIS